MSLAGPRLKSPPPSPPPHPPHVERGGDLHFLADDNSGERYLARHIRISDASSGKIMSGEILLKLRPSQPTRSLHTYSGPG